MARMEEIINEINRIRARETEIQTDEMTTAEITVMYLAPNGIGKMAAIRRYGESKVADAEMEQKCEQQVRDLFLELRFYTPNLHFAAMPVANQKSGRCYFPLLVK